MESVAALCCLVGKLACVHRQRSSRGSPARRQRASRASRPSLITRQPLTVTDLALALDLDLGPDSGAGRGGTACREVADPLGRGGVALCTPADRPGGQTHWRHGLVPPSGAAGLCSGCAQAVPRSQAEPGWTGLDRAPLCPRRAATRLRGHRPGLSQASWTRIHPASSLPSLSANQPSNPKTTMASRNPQPQALAAPSPVRKCTGGA